MDKDSMTSATSNENIQVAVFSGGPTSEHEISLLTGQAASDALLRLGHTVLPVRIERNGDWTFSDTTRLGAGAGIHHLSESGVDVAFIALHGPFGEDGTVQAILDTLGIVYQGSGVRASALGMNKSLSKAILSAHGLPVAAEVCIHRDQWDPSEALKQVEEKLSFPVFVKPVHLGSSVGAARVLQPSELFPALEASIAVDTAVLVEPLLEGKELTCGVLMDPETHQLVALPTILIEPVGHSFFDYESKYTPGHNREICPAPIAPELENVLQELAIAAHQALGCRDISRTDFIVGPNGPVILEINTLPGLTEESLIPKSAEVAGISFDQLIAQLVASTLQRSGAVI